jgi:hypothetical protein
MNVPRQPAVLSTQPLSSSWQKLSTILSLTVVEKQLRFSSIKTYKKNCDEVRTNQ